MKTIYLVWKDPACNSVNLDWLEITGQEFYALTKSPENKGRRFIKLYSVNGDGSDGNIVMECTKEDYIKWRKEKDHSDWIREGQIKTGYQAVSYHAMEIEDGCYGEEFLRDENCDVESECEKTFELEALREAVARLSENEQRMIEYFYLSDIQGTERDYAALTGISKTSVNRRKMAALKKLKSFLSE